MTARRPSLVPVRALALASILAAAAALLPLSSAHAQDFGTVTGRVTAEGGAPVQGASVYAINTQRGALTREDGSYRLQLPAGRYGLRVRIIGFAARTDSVSVSAGQTSTHDFVLTAAATQLNAVAVIGSRGEARTVIDAPVPIDVLTAADIKTSGRTETAQIIQMLAPSFNFPRPSVTDGTDHSRPATLRGLGPDQVLVLINGKRRHTSALINVNGSVGRGSTGVDLNAIPASMIDRIEILRDGAAAQYGSDAIAGVINIILKSGNGSEASTTFGQSNTNFLGTHKSDGAVKQGAINYGRVFGEKSFLHAGVELRDRGNTNRTLGDPRPQYFGSDPRNPVIGDPSTYPRKFLQGDAALKDFGGFVNGSTTIGQGGAELYGFGGASHREGKAAGQFRRPLDDRTVRAIYPDGFLPLISTKIDDISGTLGLKGDLGGVRYDLSSVYGHNNFKFDVLNSANVAIGATSPTSFYAGTLRFGQSTTNLDLFKDVKLGESFGVRTAAGAEYRADRYEIVAGDSDSYRDGGAKILDGPNAGKPPAVGAQVFAGFQPGTATKAGDAGRYHRENVAGYVDLESDLTKQLLVGLAGRTEHYTDFGSTTTGKVSGRFEPLPGYAVRGAASTGFRAPSLSQSFYSATATNFIGGVPFEVKTFPVTSKVAQLLGARPLKPEKSKNYSLGLAMEPAARLSFTLDFYRIDIRDRVVFSENFNGKPVRDFLAANGQNGVGGARYFTNAIDTRTDGLDAIANYGFDLGHHGTTRLTAGLNISSNKVTALRVNTPPELGNLNETLFGRVERTRIEKGQPRNTILLSASHQVSGVNLNLRTQRFGEVTLFGPDTVGAKNSDGSTRNVDQTFSAKWITDASIGYTLHRATLTLGADNIFDVYPDRNNNNGNALPAVNFAGNANFGTFPYNSISPFSFNGRFIYARLAYGL